MINRMAGAALGVGRSLFKGMGPADIALRLGPDAMFGVMEGAMTPGDLGDKIIAGTGSAGWRCNGWSCIRKAWRQQSIRSHA